MANPLNEIAADPIRRSNLERRFLEKIDRRGPDECWPWTSKAVTSFGYGRMTCGRRVHLKSHRIAYALFVGPIPDEGHVLHRCDNPPCCNPKHLFIGTQADNVADMRRKNRGSKPPAHIGERHHNTKFGETEAIAITNDMRAAHIIAKEFGISTKTVYRLRRGETWKEMRR